MSLARRKWLGRVETAIGAVRNHRLTRLESGPCCHDSPIATLPKMLLSAKRGRQF
jgi:hypothetical protein